MEVIDIPYNVATGIQRSEKEGYVFKLSFEPRLSNHLGTFHAAVIFGLAEASSGAFLTDTFCDLADCTVPLLRNCSGKYKKPTANEIHARCRLRDPDQPFRQEMESRRRSTIAVIVEVFDSEDTAIFTGEYEWFVSMLP